MCALCDISLHILCLFSLIGVVAFFLLTVIWALCKLYQFMDILLAPKGLGKNASWFSFRHEVVEGTSCFLSLRQVLGYPLLSFLCFFPSSFQQYSLSTYCMPENVVLSPGVMPREGKQSLFSRSSQLVGEDLRKWANRVQNVCSHEADVWGDCYKNRREGPP